MHDLNNKLGGNTTFASDVIYLGSQCMHSINNKKRVTNDELCGQSINLNISLAGKYHS